MTQILTRAGCFVAMILLGYFLRRIGFFGPEAFGVLSKIVVKITLPAAIVSGFAGKEIDPALLSPGLIALGAGLVYMALGYLISRKESPGRRAFSLLNLAGYNIGNFTLPFVQSFLGPMGIVTASLFDTGNACICLGTAYSVATLVKEGRGFSLTRVGKALLRSVPFLCYVIVVTMNLLGIPIPGPVVECAGIIGNANAFLAMLMIGVGFRLEADRAQLGRVAKMLLARYGVALLLALGCWWLLPFGPDIRKALVILVFSPISSATPAFTGELGEDVGLSSALNSLSIVISIPTIVALLLIL